MYRTNADKLWKRFGDSREVFVYDFGGGLHEAHFRTGDKVYILSFCGLYSPDDMKKVEKALGLNVVKRPRHNQDEAEMRIGDVPLERLVNFGHRPNVAREEVPLEYQLSFSGPYMARK